MYDKLRGIDLSKPAILIRMEEIQDIRLLPENFLAYDTKYHNSNGDKQYYPLKKDQKYLLLYFMDDKGLLFTTIRRWTPANWEYYFQNQACGFDIKLNYSNSSLER